MPLTLPYDLHNSLIDLITSGIAHPRCASPNTIKLTSFVSIYCNHHIFVMEFLHPPFPQSYARIFSYFVFQDKIHVFFQGILQFITFSYLHFIFAPSFSFTILFHLPSTKFLLYSGVFISFHNSTCGNYFSLFRPSLPSYINNLPGGSLPFIFT